MAPQKIIDSHIHLWAHATSNNASHAWMQEGHHLTRQHSIADYLVASDPEEVEGFVFVETDPRIKDGEKVSQWAEEPLREVKLLDRLIRGELDEASGFGAKYAGLVKGIVPWAPLDRAAEGLREYLAEVRRMVSDETWGRIKGFRFLLQGMRDQEQFTKLVLSDGCVEALKYLKKNGNEFAFDVGVDQHSGGVWQLEVVAELMESVQEGGKPVTFVMSKSFLFVLDARADGNQTISASLIWKVRQ